MASLPPVVEFKCIKYFRLRIKGTNQFVFTCIQGDSEEYVSKGLERQLNKRFFDENNRIECFVLDKEITKEEYEKYTSEN